MFEFTACFLVTCFSWKLNCTRVGYGLTTVSMHVVYCKHLTGRLQLRLVAIHFSCFLGNLRICKESNVHLISHTLLILTRTLLSQKKKHLACNKCALLHVTVVQFFIFEWAHNKPWAALHVVCIWAILAFVPVYSSLFSFHMMLYFHQMWLVSTQACLHLPIRLPAYPERRLAYHHSLNRKRQLHRQLCMSNLLFALKILGTSLPSAQLFSPQFVYNCN